MASPANPGGSGVKPTPRPAMDQLPPSRGHQGQHGKGPGMGQGDGFNRQIDNNPPLPQSYQPVGANNPSVPNPPLPQQLPQDVQGMLAGKGNTATAVANPNQQPLPQKFDGMKGPMLQATGVNKPIMQADDLAALQQMPGGSKGPMADNKAYPQSPFRQDGNSPYAPMGHQSDNYFGMYPKGQPQFGSNPYTPQTANLVGQPGSVKTMATGGNSSSGNVAMWQGATPGGSSSNQAFSGYTYNPTGGYYTNDAGQMFMPSQRQNTGYGMGSYTGYGRGQDSQNLGGGWYMTPIGGHGGYGHDDDTHHQAKKPAVAPAAPIQPNVYQQTYDYGTPQQSASVNQTPYNGNIDAAGLPLFNAGGLTRR